MSRIQHASLVRTRSNHVVSSPRRISSPLKARSNHVAKKRRTATALAPSRLTNLQVTEDEVEEDDVITKQVKKGMGKAKLGRRTLYVEVNKKRDQEEGPDVFGSGTAQLEAEEDEEEYESSPRKRKRSGGESYIGSGESSSWVEMASEEDEPEFIAEGGLSELWQAIQI
jgi:hypothetical protein